MDLLAVDRRGRTIVVELKKDRSPRDIIAQALEYVAYIDGLGYDELNSIASAYFAKTDAGWSSLSDGHMATFEVNDESDEIAWNHDQVILLIAQVITPEIIDVSRYLRRHNVDVRAIQFNYFKSDSGERLIITQMVVGQERLPASVSEETTPLPSLDQLAEMARPPLRPLVNALRSKLRETFQLMERPGQVTFGYDRQTSKGPRVVFVIWPRSGASRPDIISLQVMRSGFELLGGNSQVLEVELAKAGFELSSAKTQLSVLLSAASDVQGLFAILVASMADATLEPPP